MSWLTLTAQHLAEGLTGLELTALRTLQLDQGQTDPVPDALTRTTYEVRGYVAAFHGTAVGQPGTIPEELLSSAIAIARWRVLGRLPVKQLATDGRRKEYEDAIAQLRDVAAGKFAISVASDPAAEQPRPQAGGLFGSQPSIFGTSA